MFRSLSKAAEVSTQQQYIQIIACPVYCLHKYRSLEPGNNQMDPILFREVYRHSLHPLLFQALIFWLDVGYACPLITLKRIDGPQLLDGDSEWITESNLFLNVKIIPSCDTRILIKGAHTTFSITVYSMCLYKTAGSICQRSKVIKRLSTTNKWPIHTQ